MFKFGSSWHCCLCFSHGYGHQERRMGTPADSNGRGGSSGHSFSQTRELAQEETASFFGQLFRSKSPLEVGTHKMVWMISKFSLQRHGPGKHKRVATMREELTLECRLAGPQDYWQQTLHCTAYSQSSGWCRSVWPPRMKLHESTSWQWTCAVVHRWHEVEWQTAWIECRWTPCHNWTLHL